VRSVPAALADDHRETLACVTCCARRSTRRRRTPLMSNTTFRAPFSQKTREYQNVSTSAANNNARR
jgi:hypothetical protein